MLGTQVISGYSEKIFTVGTHRRCSPGETWNRIQPHFSKTGLTRVADVTGLDRIGIPVTVAYRPDSPTMANSTGKGLTLEAALVSGAMEAMELYHAEHVELPVLVCSHNDMARQGQVMAAEDLPRMRHSVFSAQWREHWVIGRDLFSGDDIAVPYALVAMWDENLDRLNNLRSFQVGSNGLASGNELSEALVSALLEVIERDAVTSHKVATQLAKRPPNSVRLETVTAPLIRILLERLNQARVAVELLDCGTDIEIPVYLCRLYDAEVRQVGVAAGYGAHLDPEIAMLRAVTEAAQARAVIIAGSRDDIFRRGLRQEHPTDTPARLDAVVAGTASVDVSSLLSQATHTFEGDIDLLLAKLQRAGLSQVIAFDLTRPGFPFSVVRVVVPGLEGYKFDYYTPGRRALALAQRRQQEVEFRV